MTGTSRAFLGAWNCHYSKLLYLNRVQAMIGVNILVRLYVLLWLIFGKDGGEVCNTNIKDRCKSSKGNNKRVTARKVKKQRN